MAISPSGAVAHALDRDSLIAWFEKNRARSAQLFAMLDADTYYPRPISLRNPIVFYEGHLPAFNVIVLIKRGLGQPGVDEKLERLFARGIDPEDEQRRGRATPRRRGRRARPCRPTRAPPTI